VWLFPHTCFLACLYYDNKEKRKQVQQNISNNKTFFNYKMIGALQDDIKYDKNEKLE
jgi:hypothetical protein